MDHVNTYPLVTSWENRYGRLVVELASPLMAVRDIRGRDLAADVLFGLETAEQIVLITDNRRVQIGFTSFDRHGRGYLIVHVSPSHAYVARVVELEYRGANARQEIEAAHRCAPF